MSDSYGDTNDQQSKLQKLKEKLRIGERKKHRDEISKLENKLEETTNMIRSERQKYTDEISKLENKLDEATNMIRSERQKYTDEISKLENRLEETTNMIRIERQKHTDEISKLENKLEETTNMIRSEKKKHADEISKLEKKLDDTTNKIRSEKKKHADEINELKDELDEKDREIADLKEKLKKFKKENSNNQIRKTDSDDSQKTKISNWNREDASNRDTVRHSNSDSFYSPISDDLFCSENSGSNYATNAHSGYSYHTPQRSMFGGLSSLFENSMTERIPSASSGMRGISCPQQPKRITYTPSQKEQLENAFKTNHYIKGENKKQMAASLNISEKQVQTWFNNRRARDKN